MDHLTTPAVPTAIFGEPAYDTVVNPVAKDGGISVDSTPASSVATELSVSELIARYPLLAVTAAGAVGLLAVMQPAKPAEQAPRHEKQERA
jgi:ribosomal protein L12E/L44/L45/RPP1/RPP2